ncbi:MAG: 1-acyl-sn-glycerol-3-phosphate acyltransferase [Cyclobacteriaceae bacterium]|jgi:1-acyl-sn-glycerol-3-phosphate acyltransferase|nr:1-acyl-sn-glycerol-3-phosphate acyltransferase [Cyclobacteriaceae bacterium]
MFASLARLILKLSGWQVQPAGTFPIKPPRCVLAVAPHTSGWDFIIGLLYRSALQLTNAKYIGKAELFKPPFGFLFRRLGGIPVDRSKRQNLVSEVAAVFTKHEKFMVALSPEGTRQRVDKLRTGFYNIARQAGVPIVMVGLDFENKRLIFSEPLYTGDSMEVDMDMIIRFFAPIKGKKPALGLSHLLLKN